MEAWNKTEIYCFRCGHRWVSRNDKKPESCPICRSRRYDIPSGEYVCRKCGESWIPEIFSESCPGCGTPIYARSGSEELLCRQCGHRWASRGGDYPVKCPSCRSRKWNEQKISSLTCRKCGYVWKSRTDLPVKCPKCKSKTWNTVSFKLKCFRCGYKWILSEGIDPESVRSCPSCRSKLWNELPGLKECGGCGRLFVPTRRERLCPACQGSAAAFEFRCGFCGTGWVSDDRVSRLCPGCGIVLSNSGQERSIVLWENPEHRLVYLFKDGIGCVYLWNGKYPECCAYMNELVDALGVRFETMMSRSRSAMYEKFWNSVIAGMLEKKDSYKDNIPYFIRRLGLEPFQAQILALHFTGMSPEVISIRLNMNLKDIRKEFTAIQDAYSESGIVVNDSVYTEDPISMYDPDDSPKRLPVSPRLRARRGCDYNKFCFGQITYIMGIRILEIYSNRGMLN